MTANVYGASGYRSGPYADYYHDVSSVIGHSTFPSIDETYPCVCVDQGCGSVSGKFSETSGVWSVRSASRYDSSI